MKRGLVSLTMGAILAGAGACVCLAQEPAAKQEQPGTVIGHVFYAETNGPARLAQVRVKLVDEVRTEAAKKKGEPPTPRSQNAAAAQTDLEGSFSIPNLKPGQYFVLPEQAGYVSAINGFAEEQLGRPTPEVYKRLMKELDTVTVKAGQISTIDLRLQRGAAMSGRVSFDDGSPAPKLDVFLETKNKDGGWDPESYVTSGRRDPSTTDDLGQFRIPSLMPGEYRLGVDLSMSRSMRAAGLNGRAEPATMFDLYVYFGDAFRAEDAAPIKLAAGEEKSGLDIEIPLAKLHRIAGKVVPAGDGNPVNYGTVSLRDVRDKKVVHKQPSDADEEEEQGGERFYGIADVDVGEDGTFVFEFVPDGEYVLEVTEAQDKRREDLTKPDPSTGMLSKETVLHEYGDVEQPLLVKGEMNGVVVTVTEKEGKPPKATH